jgi:hypothetical protein
MSSVASCLLLCVSIYIPDADFGRLENPLLTMEIGVGFLSVIEPITLCIIQRKFLNSAFGKKKLAQCSLEVEKNYSYFFKSN